MRYSLNWILFTLLIASFILSSCAAAPEAPLKEIPAVAEPVEGSELKRVKLTAKAAARLGILTDVVQEAVVTRKRAVGGTVVDSQSVSAGNAASVPVTGAGDMFVSVRLSETDLNLLDKSQPARVRLTGADSSGNEILAEPIGLENAASNFNAPLYFKVNGNNTSLSRGQNVFVEYYLSGNGAKKLTVPYSAVLYDLKGNTWVYTTPSQLVFIRAAITIDYVDGDRAILLNGPPAGTQIVTVGVPELYGIDTGVGK